MDLTACQNRRLRQEAKYFLKTHCCLIRGRIRLAKRNMVNTKQYTNQCTCYKMIYRKDNNLPYQCLELNRNKSRKSSSISLNLLSEFHCFPKISFLWIAQQLGPFAIICDVIWGSGWRQCSHRVPLLCVFCKFIIFWFFLENVWAELN